MAASALGASRKGNPCLKNIQPGESVILGDIQGPGVIHHIWITVTDRTSDTDRYVLRDLVLKMYWDEEEWPSVECPLGDFFCCGFGTSYFVNSLPVTVAPARGFNCYFQMPFRKSARIVLENQHQNAIPEFFYQIDYCLMDSLSENVGYFHAYWRRQRITRLKEDYAIIDRIRGSYIGTFLGYPYYSAHDEAVHNPYHNDDCPPMRAFYRWHLMNPVIFFRRAEGDGAADRILLGRII